jgi:hypothetical protein
VGAWQGVAVRVSVPGAVEAIATIMARWATHVTRTYSCEASTKCDPLVGLDVCSQCVQAMHVYGCWW